MQESRTESKWREEISAFICLLIICYVCIQLQVLRSQVVILGKGGVGGNGGVGGKGGSVIGIGTVGTGGNGGNNGGVAGKGGSGGKGERWRVANAMSMLEKEIAMNKAKMMQL